ncbi:MAG TPA: hypothetical protein DC034_14860 [Clostridium sp.]|jgi:hypothetical protein|uniref:Uncharacterized protein n=2 Tax=Clostridium kluyveri TaxID=1534 RepID=A5MYT5_CLOK5|nr:hypothetical protein [Clostridium kluyveri]EDK34031.1 Hypothetical protein CKL_2019 [Clostridium kluyveri DSM 555]BAH06817.1 hypothetical protein CKR_1766 [Clostridium kluyveri NBRC 12016]HBC98057.1 hypothetical protein [Clostridium sp.]
MNDIDQNMITAIFKGIEIFLKGYSTFRKKNSEQFIGKILNGDLSKENIDKLLDKIHSDNNLKLQLHYIIDKVSNELIGDKIQLWANAYKNLSNDIYTNEFFLKTLSNMSYLEYIVLQSYSDNSQPMNTYSESTTIVAKNKLVAMGLLIYKNYTNPFNWGDLKTGTDIKTEYILSEFGTKMLEFLSDYKD